MAGGLSFGQTEIPPVNKVTGTSFAIIIDSRSYAECERQVKAYRDVLESEGLPTTIVYDEWQSPEAVKKVLQELRASRNLEGCVLVGDIPIALVRRAQHLTTAFKMDEKRDRLESSVPSDRFYDDFDLRFDFLGREERNPLIFYYDLAVDSPQSIKCDIYSARVKPVANGKDKYVQLREFFTKAVNAHRNATLLDNFVSYTGEGSYSNSLTAWSPEMTNIREQMPGVFDRTNSARFLRYNMAAYPKDMVVNILRRPEVDLMIFHGHGMPYRQYLSGSPAVEDDEAIEQMKLDLRNSVRRTIRFGKEPGALISEYSEKYGLDTTWFAGYSDPAVKEADSLTDIRTGIVLEDIPVINPEPRMVIFDACYNGDFREDDYIAGRYIFADGGCVTTFANSVNVLQDKSANDLLGLLHLGVRAGLWAKHINILESHITGDPTFRFAAPQGAPDVNAFVAGERDAARLAETALSSPWADMRSAALHMLYAQGYEGISELLFKSFRESPYAVVRLTALSLLEKCNDSNYREALKLGTTDNFEFIRRISVHRIGRTCDESLLPYVVDAYICDRLAARVTFNVSMSLKLFDKETAAKVINERVEAAAVFDRETMRKELLDMLEGNFYSEALTTITDRSLTDKQRMLYLGSYKNLNLAAAVEPLCAIAEDGTESDELRTSVLQTLAWYNLSVCRGRIEAACSKVMNDGSASESLRGEARRTLGVLTRK